MAPARVLVCYGSETGNVRRGIHACVKHLTNKKEHGKAYTILPSYVITGNETADEFDYSLPELRANFDVLIVATSSFGEGDPPANLIKFMLMLVRAKNALEKKPGRALPLVGLQHAIIGYGQSVYKTFQSCPRFIDKLLEELGSRRMLQRVEIDEGPDETLKPGADLDDGAWTAMSSGAEDSPLTTTLAGRHVKLRRFVESVHTALLKADATASQPAVCKWTEPGNGQVVEKTEEELKSVRPATVPDEGMPQWLKYAAVAGVAAALTHYVHVHMLQQLG